MTESSIFCNQHLPNHEVLIRYVRQFLLHHRGRRKFSITFLTELAHTFLNFLSYGDEPFVEFFRWLKAEGFLDSTIVILYSDHGSRYSGSTIIIIILHICLFFNQFILHDHHWKCLSETLPMVVTPLKN